MEGMERISPRESGMPPQGVAASLVIEPKPGIKVSISEWIFGILSGLSVIAIAGLIRNAVSLEHRLTAVESDQEHMRELVEEKLERLSEKIGQLPRGRGSRGLSRES